MQPHQPDTAQLSCSGDPNASDPLVAAATERALRELLELVPEDPVTHHKYGQFLASQKRPEEAAAQFRLALDLQPEFPEALRSLATLLSAQRNFSEAIALLRHAVALRPDDVPALCDLGNALVNFRRGREAIIILQHALRLSPQEYRLHSNLGLAFTEAALFEEAEKAFHVALQLKPMFVPAHNNLGQLYILWGRFDEALACLDLAENLDRHNLITKCNRAIALLSTGDYARGWRDYQLRWDRPETSHRSYPQPLWKGEPLNGRRILLYTEEGLGDRIQFIRYAQLLSAQGAQVICECPMPLIDVFRGAKGVAELVQLGDALPNFDFHTPLLSLPHLFQTTLDSVPADVPYLAAESDRIASWRERLSLITTPGKFRIGIAWQGNPHHQWDRFRSLPLMQFEPLANIPGIRLISLQRGPGIEQIPTFQKFTNNKLIVPTDGTQSTPADLADSAAIMSCLDLVLSVDTATAHLAGALARPTWVLLSTVTDWRWLSRRSDTPWYPTMRLFRQKSLNDWDELIARVSQCLAAHSPDLTDFSASSDRQIEPSPPPGWP